MDWFGSDFQRNLPCFHPYDLNRLRTDGGNPHRLDSDAVDVGSQVPLQLKVWKSE